MFHKGCDPKTSDVILNSNLVKNEKVKWELRFDDSEGRYLVASENIKAGEVIFEEYPLSRGPIYSTKPVCLGCYRLLSTESSERHVCRNCGWPLCSAKCEKSPEHVPECQMFSEQGVKVESEKFCYDDIEPMYDIVCPVRVLWQKRFEPDKWNIFWKLMSHIDDWMQSEEWRQSHYMILDYILNTLKIDDIDEKLILTIFGIFYTNDFSTRVANKEGQRSFSKVRLCYPLSAMCSHSCIANTSRHVLGLDQNFRVVITATQIIEKGEKILFNYLDLMLPTIIRRKHLREGKKFCCNCPRCMDPTDMGTFGSSLVCQRCKKSKKGNKLTKDDKTGLIMAVNTDSNKGSNVNEANPEINSIWMCNTCGLEKTEKEVETLCSILHQKCEDLVNSIPDRHSISKYEAFIKKYSGTLLHPNHMFLTNLKYSLCGFYGRLAGYEMQEMDEATLLRKKQICEEALYVLNKIDPGIGPRRGMLMYEIHMPLIMLAKMDMENGKITKDEAKKQFLRGILHLKMSLEILQYEPDGSFEKNIYHEAKGSVEPLESFVSSL